MFSKIITLIIVVNIGFLFAQPELDIKPNRIEFKDLFNRFDRTYLINKGNQILTIDSLNFKDDIYLIAFENNLELPITINPDDSVAMDITLSGFYHVTVSDTSDTIYVFNDGIISPEPLRVKIDFFEDKFGDFTGTVVDSIIPLENSNLYFFYDGIYLIDTATTDLSGNYSISLPEGNYTIAAEKQGYYVQFHDSTYDPYFAKIEQLDSGEVKTLNFNMMAITDTTLSVSGTVSDSTGSIQMEKGIIIVRKGTHVPRGKVAPSVLEDTLYTFAGLIRPDGSFKVFVQVNAYYFLQAQSNNFLPGYYNDKGAASVFWQNADSLRIDTNVLNKNISLLRDSSHGGASISGSIQVQSEGVQSDYDGITLFARSVENGALYSYNFGKEDGVYKVTNIPYGTYEIIGQRIGWEDARSQVITIDSLNIEFDNITITFTPTDVYDEFTVPNDIILHQNYPNPFNPRTTISFYLPQESFVELKVLNILGQTVAVLLNQDLSAGKYDIKFNAVDMASGIYFYTLHVGKFVKTSKMLLLK
jgi:hypothetical protein